MSASVTEEYLMGIADARAWLKQHGVGVAQDELANLTATCRLFAASSSVGQMLRGERDFWRNQIKRAPR